MKNVIPIKPCASAVTTLRNIADMIESGELKADKVTVIAGSEVYQGGVFDDGEALKEAVFSMTFGIHKLMEDGLCESYED